MNMKKTAITTAVSGLIALGVAATAPSQAAGENEKCYGVAKAGKNDCQTATNACAGTAKVDNQADAWIYVPKGVCEKIAGGSLEAKS